MEIPTPRGYHVEELLRRFDSRIEGQTSLTGRLSSLFGEAVLVEALAHAYVSAGHRVHRLPGSPHRDNRMFTDGEIPSQRDLDAWLTLDERDLVAVECKTWTASSADGRHVLDANEYDLSRYAKQGWDEVSKILLADRWDQINKVCLPLKVPDSYDQQSHEIKRVLAIWRPISRSGLDPWSTVTSRTPTERDAWTDVPVTVFSGSLYLRRLRNSGVTVLPAVVTNPHDVREAVNACIC
ncbi:hypothetical protein ACGFIE_01215 [Micromonospora sp. NPDC049275]|uniref:hypothetical protein n=1 Tax=Micromonospora sp. NPDC049275 TaxID=3364268 RepID=UPI0037194595